MQEKHPEIAWRQIIATRNQLIHGNLGMDDDILWSILRDDMLGLLESLKAMRDKSGL